MTAAQLAVLEDEMRENLAEYSVELKVAVPPRQGFSSNEMVELARGVEVVVAGDDQMDEQFFLQCPNLKLVIRWGVGLDSVDITAAEKRKIRVENTPGILGPAVAEYVFGFIMLLMRQQHIVDRKIRGGEWLKPRGGTLRGKNLGVVGFGNIGKEIARLGIAFGMTVSWFDPGPVDGLAATSKAKSMASLAIDTDVLVLSCPLTNDTRNLINANFIKQMRSSAYIINVARGGVVNEVELADALFSGRLAGAAIDVFEQEPLPPNHALLNAPNIVFGSHNASNTEDSVREVNLMATGLVLDYLAST